MVEGPGFWGIVDFDSWPHGVQANKPFGTAVGP